MNVAEAMMIFVSVLSASLDVKKNLVSREEKKITMEVLVLQ